MYRYAVSRTFSPGAVEVVRGRGHALPPPQFRGQGQDTTFTKNRGQVQDSPSSQRSVIVQTRCPNYSIIMDSHVKYPNFSILDDSPNQDTLKGLIG
jgi:hypothetical protein